MKYFYSRFLLTPFNILVLLCLSSISCNKEIPHDDADDFVGTYKASVIDNVRWGGDSGTVTDTGTIYITKLSATRVKALGYINTDGEVIGEVIYFETMTSSDSYGNLTTVFQQGVLRGNVLTFTTVTTGQLKYNGTMYPYSATSTWTCIRQQ